MDSSKPSCCAEQAGQRTSSGPSASLISSASTDPPRSSHPMLPARGLGKKELAQLSVPRVSCVFKTLSSALRSISVRFRLLTPLCTPTEKNSPANPVAVEHASWAVCGRERDRVSSMGLLASAKWQVRRGMTRRDMPCRGGAAASLEAVRLSGKGCTSRGRGRPRPCPCLVTPNFLCGLWVMVGAASWGAACCVSVDFKNCCSGI